MIVKRASYQRLTGVTVEHHRDRSCSVERLRPNPGVHRHHKLRLAAGSDRTHRGRISTHVAVLRGKRVTLLHVHASFSAVVTPLHISATLCPCQTFEMCSST